MLYSSTNTFAEYDCRRASSEEENDRVYNHLAELVLSSGRYEHLKIFHPSWIEKSNCIDFVPKAVSVINKIGAFFCNIKSSLLPKNQPERGYGGEKER